MEEMEVGGGGSDGGGGGSKRAAAPSFCSPSNVEAKVLEGVYGGN